MEFKTNNGYVFEIDEIDLPLVLDTKWCARKNGRRIYIVRTVKHKTEYLHRCILNAPKNIDVDHIDGNGLNNKRSNIRTCNRSENMANVTKYSNNKSGYRGVDWHTQRNKWRARIQKDGKEKHLGLFKSPEEAAKAYDTASVDLFGEFARTNF